MLSQVRSRPGFVPPYVPGSGRGVVPPSGELKRGSTGTKVADLQSLLLKEGLLFKGEYTSGTFNAATEAAVRSLQKRWQLKSDGVYGPMTKKALERELAGEKAPGVEVKKPGTTWAASPNHDDRRGKDIDAIVIHHTASNNGAADLAHLRDPAAKVSAHYMIDQDGTIYQLVADGLRAWHAGASELHGVPDVNSRSIGIELVNKGDGKTPFTEAQYKALEQLVPYLAKTYAVPRENLVGHKDVAIPPGRKNDPAPNFDWNRLRRAMAEAV